MGNFFLSPLYLAINFPNFPQHTWILFLLFFFKDIFLKKEMTEIPCPVKNNLPLWGVEM